MYNTAYHIDYWYIIDQLCIVNKDFQSDRDAVQECYLFNRIRGITVQ